VIAAVQLLGPLQGVLVQSDLGQRDIAVREVGADKAVLLVVGHQPAALLERRQIDPQVVIAPPSFYSAFGSKERLFREAVDLYYAGMSKVMGAALEAPTARDAIGRLLHTAVDQFGGSDGPRGCLIVLGATNATRGNQAAHDHLKALRDEAPDVIRARLARGVKDGDVPADAPIGDMALFFTTVLHGMAIRARDNGSRQVLTTIADTAMAAWEPLVGKQRGARAKEKRPKTPSTARPARRS
jgi:AcrR family transcriptional regulator